MTLLSKASLVATPTAYGDGVLNSVKPTDGTGDFDFARASSATRVNEQGLIEKERENLLLQSNQFDTSWTLSSASLASGQSGYDGTNDAWLFTTTIAGATLLQSITSSGVVVFSMYAKKGTVNGIRLRIDAATDADAYFNLSNGSVHSFTGSAIDASMISLGSGWYRCQISANISSPVKVAVYTTDGTTAYDNGNIYIQDAQLEAGLVATDYIETTTSSVAVGITNDIPRINYENGIGNFLLEPQRTNNIAYSEYFNGLTLDVVTVAYNVISPENITNAATLTGTDVFPRVKFFPALSDNTAYCVSVFVKSGTASVFGILAKAKDGSDYQLECDLSDGSTTSVGTNTPLDLGSVNYGNGWYRFYMVYNSLTGATSSPEVRLVNHRSSSTNGWTNGLTILAYGGMHEQGSYPTSYIPTYGSAVTRAAETCNNAGNSGLFNDSEGVLYAEFKNEDVADYRLISISDGTTNNRIFIGTRITTGYIYYFVLVGGALSSTYISTQLASDFNKVALKYKTNDFALWINGTEVYSDTSGATYSANTLDRLNFDNAAGASNFVGKTKMVATFKEALSDSELECLTSWSSFERMATAQNYTIE